MQPLFHLESIVCRYLGPCTFSSPQCTELDLSKADLATRDLDDIASALPSATRLYEIELDNMRLDDSDVIRVLDAITGNSIGDVDLSGNLFGDAAVPAGVPGDERF